MEIPEIHVADENNVLKKYTDPIDLSNACRAFYQSRLEMTKTLKAQWKLSVVSCAEGLKKRPTRKESLDGALHKLKHEMINIKTAKLSQPLCKELMSVTTPPWLTFRRGLDYMNKLRQPACLMEQDLFLMKQMLTLNEEIEDLKWRRRHVWGASASSFYSSDMIQSNASIGRMDEQAPLKFSPPSSLSLQLDAAPTRFSVYNDDDPCGTFNRKTMSYKNYLANRKSVGRAPFVLASVPNSGKASPETEDLSKKTPLDDLESKVKDFSVSSAKTRGNSCLEPTKRLFAGETLSLDSNSLPEASSSDLDEGNNNCKTYISDVRPIDISICLRRTGKMLHMGMDSQDSGIHDCNGNSL